MKDWERLMAYQSNFKNIKRSALPKMDKYKKDNIFLEYKQRCHNLSLGEDNVVRGLHKYGYNDDTLWFMLGFVVAYDNMVYTLGSLEDVHVWFRRPHDKAPFAGKSPLEFIQADARNSTLLRFYSNGVVEQYIQKWQAIPYNPAPIEVEITPPTLLDLDLDDLN